ncbi:ACT domain protein [Desulfamplus magnetovallimortis]|uniref:ACT domain protein n=1 Tax=Desulfamplus magnetovallimortis TaxID=1246637 RepID=A0A1W1HC35_9BACT|nr:ACT domain-containing protein [Desulfamplus magnetovallimortis]SLM30009.1 ACT domain protein [Desulfamplus magnetovallimortis]
MRVEQISIFLENKAGRLAEVTAILRDANVNIRALSLADTTDFGILRLIVNNNQAAEEALKKEGFTVGKTNVLAIEVDDSPGGLNNVLDPLTSEGVNVEYMYAFANPHGKNAIMIFRFHDLDKAIGILKEKGINVINGADVYNL